MPNPKDSAPGSWAEHRFVSFDGTPIFYRRYTPGTALRGSILILHGMGEHSGRYREFAETLGAAGFEATLPDLRGFGQSGGKRGCLRHFKELFYDLDAVFRLIKQRHAHLPLFAMGHSFGGLTVSSWLSGDAENKGVRGLILTSPNFGIAIHVPLWREILAVIASSVAPDFTQDNRVDRNFLTHDTAILERSKVDRFNHHRISASLYHELILQLDRRMEIAARLRLPALVLQAGDDHVVSKEATVAFYEGLTSGDKELEVYEGLYHEILNETIRHEIYAKIITWTEKRL